MESNSSVPDVELNGSMSHNVSISTTSLVSHVTTVSDITDSHNSLDQPKLTSSVPHTNSVMTDPIDEPIDDGDTSNLIRSNTVQELPSASACQNNQDKASTACEPELQSSLEQQDSLSSKKDLCHDSSELFPEQEQPLSDQPDLSASTTAPHINDLQMDEQRAHYLSGLSTLNVLQSPIKEGMLLRKNDNKKIAQILRLNSAKSSMKPMKESKNWKLYRTVLRGPAMYFYSPNIAAITSSRNKFDKHGLILKPAMFDTITRHLLFDPLETTETSRAPSITGIPGRVLIDSYVYGDVFIEVDTETGSPALKHHVVLLIFERSIMVLIKKSVRATPSMTNEQQAALKLDSPDQPSKNASPGFMKAKKRQLRQKFFPGSQDVYSSPAEAVVVNDECVSELSVTPTKTLRTVTKLGLDVEHPLSQIDVSISKSMDEKGKEIDILLLSVQNKLSNVSRTSYSHTSVYKFVVKKPGNLDAWLQHFKESKENLVDNEMNKRQSSVTRKDIERMWSQQANQQDGGFQIVTEAVPKSRARKFWSTQRHPEILMNMDDKGTNQVIGGSFEGLLHEYLFRNACTNPAGSQPSSMPASARNSLTDTLDIEKDDLYQSICHTLVLAIVNQKNGQKWLVELQRLILIQLDHVQRQILDGIIADRALKFLRTLLSLIDSNQAEWIESINEFLSWLRSQTIRDMTYESRRNEMISSVSEQLEKLSHTPRLTKLEEIEVDSNLFSFLSSLSNDSSNKNSALKHLSTQIFLQVDASKWADAMYIGHKFPSVTWNGFIDLLFHIRVEESSPPSIPAMCILSLLPNNITCSSRRLSFRLQSSFHPLSYWVLHQILSQGRALPPKKRAKVIEHWIQIGELIRCREEESKRKFSLGIWKGIAEVILSVPVSRLFRTWKCVSFESMSIVCHQWAPLIFPDSTLDAMQLNKDVKDDSLSICKHWVNILDAKNSWTMEEVDTYKRSWLVVQKYHLLYRKIEPHIGLPSKFQPVASDPSLEQWIQHVYGPWDSAHDTSTVITLMDGSKLSLWEIYRLSSRNHMDSDSEFVIDSRVAEHYMRWLEHWHTESLACESAHHYLPQSLCAQSCIDSHVMKIGDIRHLLSTFQTQSANFDVSQLDKPHSDLLGVNPGIGGVNVEDTKWMALPSLWRKILLDTTNQTDVYLEAWLTTFRALERPKLILDSLLEFWIDHSDKRLRILSILDIWVSQWFEDFSDDLVTLLTLLQFLQWPNSSHDAGFVKAIQKLCLKIGGLSHLPFHYSHLLAQTGHLPSLIPESGWNAQESLPDITSLDAATISSRLVAASAELFTQMDPSDWIRFVDVLSGLENFAYLPCQALYPHLQSTVPNGFGDDGITIEDAFTIVSFLHLPSQQIDQNGVLMDWYWKTIDSSQRPATEDGSTTETKTVTPLLSLLPTSIQKLHNFHQNLRGLVIHLIVSAESLPSRIAIIKKLIRTVGLCNNAKCSLASRAILSGLISPQSRSFLRAWHAVEESNVEELEQGATYIGLLEQQWSSPLSELHHDKSLDKFSVDFDVIPIQPSLLDALEVGIDLTTQEHELNCEKTQPLPQLESKGHKLINMEKRISLYFLIRRLMNATTNKLEVKKESHSNFNCLQQRENVFQSKLMLDLAVAINTASLENDVRNDSANQVPLSKLSKIKFFSRLLQQEKAFRKQRDKQLKKMESAMERFRKDATRAEKQSENTGPLAKLSFKRMPSLRKTMTPPPQLTSNAPSVTLPQKITVTGQMSDSGSTLPVFLSTPALFTDSSDQVPVSRRRPSTAIEHSRSFNKSIENLVNQTFLGVTDSGENLSQVSGSSLQLSSTIDTAISDIDAPSVIIPLLGAKATPKPGYNNRSNVFQITLNDDKEIYLQCDTSEDLTEWCDLINLSIQDASKRFQYLGEQESVGNESRSMDNDIDKLNIADSSRSDTSKKDKRGKLFGRPSAAMSQSKASKSSKRFDASQRFLVFGFDLVSLLIHESDIGKRRASDSKGKESTGTFGQLWTRAKASMLTTATASEVLLEAVSDSSLLEWNETNSIPILVAKCVHEVETRGLKEIGIYRLSGSTVAIQQLKKRFDTDAFTVEIGVQEAPDINVVTGLLKLWLRELPEPLLTYELFDAFMASSDLVEYNDRLLSLKELIHQLPKPNFFLLKFLIQHLVHVTEYESVNNMYATNLAIVFGPTILRTPPLHQRSLGSQNYSESNDSYLNQEAAQTMVYLGKFSTIVKNMIVQFHWLFDVNQQQDQEQDESEGMQESNTEEQMKDIHMEILEEVRFAGIVETEEQDNEDGAKDDTTVRILQKIDRHEGIELDDNDDDGRQRATPS